MIKKVFSTFFLLNLFAIMTIAQELEFPLSCNPAIKEYLQKNPVSYNSNLRTGQNTITLPFEDDFSYSGIYPNTQLWMDSDAFVNQTMCDNPVTIGVATFDGINKYGEPHDSNSTSATPVICDYLTSQPIDLDSVSAGDSLYFSFYYQPQGLGDEPEDGDSLTLQFYAFNGVDSDWVNIWVANGRPDSAFSEVRINIVDQAYFWVGFQFRFYNYGTPNGNRDHWNIDYVNLDRDQSSTQPLNEITLIQPVQSYLEQYTAMPYSHYKSEIISGNNPLKNSIIDTIRTYEFTGLSTSARLDFSVTDKNGNSIFNQFDSEPDLHEFTDTAMQVTIPSGLFPITTADFADFFIQHQMDATASGWSTNDTSNFTQHFYNYYSYDDGSAESATGVHVAYTKYAYRFDVKQSDSLLGISIYFNPWGKNVHQDLFSLCLWSSVNVSANTATLVHQSIDNKPANNDSINGFVDYYFDAAQWVNAGTNYIGIIQSSINEIGIGVDHNTDSHDKMFLEFNNQWVQSTITGSWMMRPIFGKKLTIGVNEVAQLNSQFEIYPNPSKNKLTVGSRQLPMSSISIYNVLGQNVLDRLFPNATRGETAELDVSSLSDGVYLIRILDSMNNYTEVKKMIIQH